MEESWSKPKAWMRSQKKAVQMRRPRPEPRKSHVYALEETLLVATLANIASTFHGPRGNHSSGMSGAAEGKGGLGGSRTLAGGLFPPFRLRPFGHEQESGWGRKEAIPASAATPLSTEPPSKIVPLPAPITSLKTTGRGRNMARRGGLRTPFCPLLEPLLSNSLSPISH